AKELKTVYTPIQADVDALTKWLKEQNFTINQISPDRTSVYATASVDQIAKSLQVSMVRVTRDGVTYTAAKNAPSLPAEVGNSVHAIIGLQPFRHANKHLRKFMAPLSAAPAPNVQNAPPFFVSEILKAYNADGLNVTGSGQTIAILIDTFPDPNDLKKFWQKNQVNVTMSQITKINVTGAVLPPQEGEETLDVSWTSGIAPGAKVRVYVTGTLQFTALDKALDRIIKDLPTQPGMRQLSISLGLGETFMGGPTGEAAVQHAKFLRLAAAGVNVFVSSGDAGSNPDATGHSATGSLQAEYSASDSAVIGVGGTTLGLAATGSVTSEIGWTSGGGGRSIFFKRPSWQVGAGIPAGTDRLVPDVSLVADPNTGAFLVLHGKQIQIGGTSWSAPVWAGFCALINEARAKAGKPFLPFLNPLLYPLIGTSCFRDIKTGNNGGFQAGSGYDLVTGLGVPNVKELIKALTT
ncbi:MAG: peptidase propeptide, partial [Chthonomonadales bacterium]|nr:peptidase propeptide [Chthonomonadales bacterium]